MHVSSPFGQTPNLNASKLMPYLSMQLAPFPAVFSDTSEQLHSQS